MSHQLDPLHLFFVNKRLNLGHGKLLKGPGKGHGKFWNFKLLKGYEP